MLSKEENIEPTDPLFQEMINIEIEEHDKEVEKYNSQFEHRPLSYWEEEEYALEELDAWFMINSSRGSR